jgi:pimeloyl-ACP methyl ester carboxylesterase
MWRGLTLLLFAALSLGCQGIENHLVFQPTHTPEPRSGSDGFRLSASDSALRAYPLDLVTADGTRVRAWWCPYPGCTGAVLYCHGNAGDLNDRIQPIAAVMAELHQSVLAFDYPGFGLSGGRPSEPGCFAAADAGYDWLTARGVRAEEIILVGVSLGGAVAVDLAARRPARALVLVKTFTSIPAVAAHLLLGAPVGPFMVNRFDSAAKIGLCAQPVFVASGTNDRLVPYRHGERLYAAAPGRKQFYPIEGSDHNDPLTPDFFTALRAFLDAEKER